MAEILTPGVINAGKLIELLKKYKINKYPSCLSLFDINERKLKYETDYVKNNCISS